MQISIVLLITILAAQTVYAENSLKAPPLDLKIPKPLIIKPGDSISEGQTLITFNIEQYGTILKIGTGYKLWTKNYPLRSKVNDLWQLRLNTCHERVNILKEVNETLQEDREYSYKLFYDEREYTNKLETKNKLRTILVASGGVVIGIAIGIIIGTVITN